MGIFDLGFWAGRGRIGFSSGTENQNKALPANLDYTSVEQMYDTLKANYDGKLDTTKLLDGIKTGLAQSTGDPYTVYFNSKSAKDFNNQLNGTFSGIGAELGQNPQGDLVIVAPIDGAPASKAGLRPQDIVATINGTTTTGMTIDDAVNKIRGPKGSKVTLGIVRDKTLQTVNIVRDNIKIASVKWQILDGNVGYMQINEFSDDTAKLARQAAQDFADHNVKGVVLDLRGNPGGLLDAAVSVSSLWLPQGALVLQEKRDGVVISSEFANGDNPLKGIKTAILIDAGSASASEITAGALRDNNVATLYGVKSYGKGSVQQIEQLPGGGELKVTIARWYRPNGQNIDKKGIKPDHEVKRTDDDFKSGNDPQKDAAISFINS
ncbi:MAG TPA: S41 family peptidase [Candidatus Saccharimonadales bacterium]|nr:S41 family peptidase [Candidatus Saccharimonadales bacterium]